MRLAFPHRLGRFRHGILLFSSPGCWSCGCMEGFLIRGWDPIVLGWRWLYSRAPANQRSASWTGVSTPCGTVSTRGITVFAPGCRSCRCMEGFLIRGWDFFVHGWRWRYSRAPVNQRSAVGLGLPHSAGRFQPGGSPFSSPGCRSCRCTEGFLFRGWDPVVLGWR